MNTHEEDLKQRMELLPGYVQPRYKQERDSVLDQLKRALAHSGSYPQLVDPSIVEIGDEITIVRAIETKPLWKATIRRITPLISPSTLDVIFDMTPPERIEGRGTDPLPTQRRASELGFAELSPGGLDLPDDYFAYANVFLSGVDMPTEPVPVTAPRVDSAQSTLPEGWWGWDV